MNYIEEIKALTSRFLKTQKGNGATLTNEEMTKYAKRGTLENYYRSETIENLLNRTPRVPDQPESPPSPTPEQVWARDMLDVIEKEIMPRLGDLENFIIFIENQFAAVNKGNLHYRPRFMICIARPGAEPYVPELRRVREQVEAAVEELEGQD